MTTNWREQLKKSVHSIAEYKALRQHFPNTELESAARAYVLARESGRPTTQLYRRLRRAWIAAVRADALMRRPK